MTMSLSTVAVTAIFILLSNSNCICLSNDEPAKDYSWQEMMDSSNTYLQAQGYQTALKWALQAEVKAKEVFGEMDTNYVATIGSISELYYYAGNLDSAIFYGFIRLSICKKKFKGDHPALAGSITSMANFYNSKGNYKEAEPLFKEALEMTRRIFKGDHNDLARSINEMAGFLDNKGDYKKAEPLFIEALEMYRRIFKTDHPNLAASITGMAIFYYSRGDYNKAEPLFIEALEMYRRIFKTDHPNLAASINNMAGFYNSRGDYKKAEPMFIEALDMRRRLFKTDHPDLANSISWMARFYNGRGNYKKAEPLYFEALDMRRRIFKGDHPDLARSINNMALFFRDMGNYQDAEPLYMEALEMYRRIFKGDHPFLATFINNLALFYKDIGNYSDAEPLYKEALDMRRRIFEGDHPDLANSINNMAAFYYGIGNYKEAEPLFIEALEMRRRIFKGDHPGLAASINSIAIFYISSGNYEKAEPLFKEALEMRRRIFKGDHPDLANSINCMALFFRDRGNYKDAETLFKELFTVDENIINNYFPVLSESEKENFLKTLISDYSKYHSFAYNINKTKNHSFDSLYHDAMKQEYDNLLFTKGLLLSSTNKAKEQIMNFGDSAMINLYNTLRFKREYIAKLYNMTKQELETKNINFDSVLNVANDIEKELTRKSDAFAKEFDKKIYKWQDVQKDLVKGESAIEIVRFKYHDGKRWTDTVFYVALILKSGNNANPIDFVFIENGNELEQLHIKNYKNCIKNKFQDNESFNQFWAKIASKLKGVKKVYFSPDGVYNQLNLATLYNPKTNKYLMEEMEVQVVTSTRDIVINKEQKKPEYNNTAVLIGNPRFNLNKNEYKKVAASLESKFKTDYFIDEGTEVTMRTGLHPLPGTGIEIDKISNLLTVKNWKVEKYTNEQAIEEAIKKVNNPRILHIATHGKFLSDVERQYSNFDTEIDKQRFVENPLLRSYLIFAGADSPDSTKSTDFDDGFLTAYEAQNLYLDKTELVVLSACETGLGEVKNGEGVYGLQRAFIQAGAKTLIMSLWSVSDEATQELMTTFYKEWLGGRTKRQAFKIAQQELKSRYPMPYYWGAFVMVGE